MGPKSFCGADTLGRVWLVGAAGLNARGGVENAGLGVVSRLSPDRSRRNFGSWEACRFSCDEVDPPLYDNYPTSPPLIATGGGGEGGEAPGAGAGQGGALGVGVGGTLGPGAGDGAGVGVGPGVGVGVGVGRALGAGAGADGRGPRFGPAAIMAVLKSLHQVSKSPYPMPPIRFAKPANRRRLVSR